MHQLIISPINHSQASGRCISVGGIHGGHVLKQVIERLLHLSLLEIPLNGGYAGTFETFGNLPVMVTTGGMRPFAALADEKRHRVQSGLFEVIAKTRSAVSMRYAANDCLLDKPKSWKRFFILTKSFNSPARRSDSVPPH